MLRPIRFQSAAVWMSTGLPCTLTRYVVDHGYIQFKLHKIRTARDHPERKYCVGQGVFVYIYHLNIINYNQHFCKR